MCERASVRRPPAARVSPLAGDTRPIGPGSGFLNGGPHLGQSRSPSPNVPREGGAVNVFVAGATGAIGRPLVAQLLAAGHRVVGTTRSAEKAKRLEAAGAEAIVVD